MTQGMKFLVTDLKTVERGATVVVHLSGNAANVRLMDSANYRAYKAGTRHRYLGGLMRQSPLRLVVPQRGHWYVTVDMNGLRGNARARVHVEPPALPVARSAPTSRSLAEVLREPPLVAVDGEEAWDVFICHAGEDKQAVALPLALALEERGVKVWLDTQLEIGQSLRRSIDKGLLRSRFSIVIISPASLDKQWPQYELDGIVSLTLAGKQAILPIWHDITEVEVLNRLPSLADKVARNTSTHSINEIADEIATVVQQS